MPFSACIHHQVLEIPTEASLGVRRIPKGQTEPTWEVNVEEAMMSTSAAKFPVKVWEL